MVYKWCAVPGCTNTSIKTPEKVFISLPKNRKIREKWMQLAGRNLREISEKSTPFFCEDHFCMEKDIANYRQYKMGFSQKLRVAEGAMPSKFYCQSDHRKRMSDESIQHEFIKNQKTETLQELIGTFERQGEFKAIESAVIIKTPIKYTGAKLMTGTEDDENETNQPTKHILKQCVAASEFTLKNVLIKQEIIEEISNNNAEDGEIASSQKEKHKIAASELIIPDVFIKQEIIEECSIKKDKDDEILTTELIIPPEIIKQEIEDEYIEGIKEEFELHQEHTEEYYTDYT